MEILPEKLMLEEASSVLRQFLSPKGSGKFFRNEAIPKHWRPKLLHRDSQWYIECRRHSSAFIAIELGNFTVFDHLDDLPIDETRALARPLGAWIEKLPQVQLWDQIGGFTPELGHWHFLYRDKEITGTLDVFIIPKKGRVSTLLASITEHVSFRRKK